MKYLFLILLSSLTVSKTVNANAIPEADFVRKHYPKLEQVITYISRRISTYCDECIYGVAKKPEGYFLTIESINNNPNHDLKFIKVWDRNSVDFIEFDISEFASQNRLRDVPEEFRLLHKRASYYDFFLYYGYNNWTNDTRNILRKKNYKTAEDLEILARASSSEATSYIRPGMTGDFFNFTRGLEDRGYGKTSEIQKQGFLQKAEEALNYWKELKREHPDYTPIIIEDLGLKVGNEYMHFQHLALSISENGIANSFFKNAYYSEAWVQYAKNILNSCEKNGLLFTAGDNDTYPLLYVQEKLGYRTDVTVINSSLLNTSWYLEMTRENSNIKSVVNKKNFDKLIEKPVYIDFKAPTAPFSQWLEKTLKEEDSLTYQLAPSDILLNYQDVNIKLELKTTTLAPSDIIILDIIANTGRPVHTSDPYSMVNLGLYYNLATTGRAFSVVPDMKTAMESLTTLENVEDMAFVMTAPYLKALGSSAGPEFSIFSYLVFNLPPSFQDRKEAIVEKIYHYLQPEEVVSIENSALIDALNSFYEVLKPDASEELRAAFKPIAEDLINNTSSLNLNLDDNIDEMVHIFSIYAHFKPYETPEYEIALTESDKAVLRALKEKVDQLSESPVIQERAWNRRQLFELLEAFEIVNLE